MTQSQTTELTETIRRQAGFAHDGSASDATALFLHIGKTAGTTLAAILKQQYPARDRVFVNARGPIQPADQLAALPARRVGEVRLVHGHQLYGTHIALPGPALYFTLLRDPGQRLVSAYHHVVRTRTHYAHAEVAARGLTLAEFVTSGVMLETDNWQARAVVGDEATPFGACDESLLLEARARIAEDFSLVGLSERFDQSVVLLGRMYGWRRTRYVRLNRGRGGGARAELSAADRAAIDTHTAIERELYDYAGRVMDGVITQLGGIDAALAALRRNNALYAPVGEAKERLRSQARRWRH